MKSLKDKIKCYDYCPQAAKQPPKAVEFKLRSKESMAYSYSWFYSCKLEGDHTITINFSHDIVTLKGNNLGPVNSQLIKQLLISVSECNEETLTNSDDPIILSIESQPINNNETVLTYD